MEDNYTQIFFLLNLTVLPRLKEIQAAQDEQRLQNERIERAITDFRTEMHMRFAELHAELAACRAQIEDTLVTLTETDAASSPDLALPLGAKKTLLN